MKILGALGCLVLACLIGQIFMCWGTTPHRPDWPMPTSLMTRTIFLLAYPYWFLIFLPLFLAVSAESVWWKWYVAPILGIVAGSVAYWFLFGDQHGAFSRVQLTPVITGFALFLLGAILKKWMGEDYSA